jgi:O-antigen/teichoic acid export membrane protein
VVPIRLCLSFLLGCFKGKDRMKIFRWLIIILGTASIVLPVAIVGWTYHPAVGIITGILAAAGVIVPAVWRPKIFKQ